MPTRPLNPEGGRAERLLFSVPHPWVERIDRLAERQEMSRSAYLRMLFERVIDSIDEDELLKKEASKAS